MSSVPKTQKQCNQQDEQKTKHEQLGPGFPIPNFCWYS